MEEQPQKKGHFVRNCFIFIAVVLLLLVGTVTALFFAFQNGYISQRDILGFIGQLPGEISVVNLEESNTNLALTQLDPPPDESPLTDSLTLEPLDVASFTSIPPGRYELTVEGSSANYTCNLQISSNDIYHIFPTTSGTAITRDGYNPQSADEMDMGTSSLCKQ